MLPLPDAVPSQFRPQRGAGPKFMKIWLENAFSAIWPRAILVDLGPPPYSVAIVSAAITKEIYMKRKNHKQKVLTTVFNESIYI